jgi:hypothetical protein
MPDRCSPVSEDSTLPSILPLALSLLGSARLTSIAEPCSNDIGPESLSCPTCGRSTPASGLLTCCTAAIPASRSRTPGAGGARTTRAISGPPSHEPFAYYDPDWSCWRTSQATLLSDSTECSVTLPKWGCLHGGALYELPTPAPPTNGHESSWLLPTPSASGDARNTGQTSDYHTLSQVLNLLPNPRTTDSHGPGEHGKGGRDLRTEIDLLPGANTSPPSAVGSTSPDSLRPGQLMIEDA